MAGLTEAGRGLSAALRKAADELRIPLDKLTSNRGNAVFRELSPLPFDPAAAKDEDAGVLSRMARANTKLTSEIGLAQSDKVWLALPCKLCDLMGAHSKVVLLTNLYLFVFSDDEGRPEQALAGRKLDFRLRLLDVACAVTCVRQPEFCALALDSKDRADQLFWVQQDTLRRTFFAHLDRRHRRVKPHSRGGNRKKDELDKRLQWRWCEDIDALRMIVRSDPKDSPAQLELQRGDGDELQVSRTQKLIRLLREYGDSRVAFSKVGTVISPPQKAEPGKPAGAWRARRMIALLTNTALYLIRPSEQLGFEVFRRVELPQISGVVVNERDNDEVVVRIHVLRFRLSLGGEFQRRADHETCISRALQQDLRSHDCFDPVEVREKERDAVVRVILATPGELERESRKQTARLLALPSRMDSALVGAYPGAAVKIDISDCWDMALRIEGGEDFVELLSSERLWWTSHNRPQGEGGHAEGENSNFTLDVLYEPPGAPADKSEAGRFGLLASARFPKVDVAGTKRALGDKEDPARVRRQALRWADRRLKQAVAEGGAELIEYELGRARRLGLTEHNSAQRRVHLHRGARGARGKQSVMGHAQELLNRIRDTESVRSSLQEAIARRHWGEFDRLAKLARDTGLLEPELRIQRHRSFRQGLLWRRLCGKPLDCPSASWVALCRERLTLEEARARCLAEEKFTGYTYKAAGQPGREESLAVTFVGHVAPPADPESPAGAQQEPGRGTGGWAKLRTAQRLARAAGGRLRSGAVSCGGGGPQAFAAFVRSQPWRGREAGMALAEGWTAVVKKEDELAALQRRKQLAQDQARTITRIRKCIPTLVSDSARALDVQAVDELFACARKIGCDEADLRGVNTDLTARVQGANIQRMLEAGADSQPAAAIRLLEQVWRGLPTAADDTDLGAQLAAHREKALTVRRLERKLQLAIMRGQRDRAEELLRAHGEGDLAHVAAQARGELGRLPQRDAVAERVRHMLRMYQRTLSTASSTSCDPQELDRAVGALAELHPQTKEFPSLESQELQTRVLLEGLRMRHAMREMRREHDRQIAERHDRARKAHEERRRQVQERRDLKLMRQKEEEERVARNYRRKAEEFLEDAQDWNRRVTSGPAGIPAGVLQQRRTATDSTRDAVRGARAAGNMHSALTEALEMLDQAVELWDAVHVAISSTQEEREYANLARELSEACNAGDRERVVALVRKNIADGSKTPLREVDIRRIRSQWAQYVQQQQEQSEFIEKLRTAMRERDRHELAKLLREESVLPADHEVMAEARQLSHELDAAHALQHQGSMNMHDMGMRSITGATGLSMCSPLGADNSSSVTPSGASLMQSLRVDPQAEQAKSEEDGGGGDGAFHDSDDEDSAPTPQRSPGHSTFRVPRPGAKERQGSAFAGMLRTTTARTEGDGASVASESPPPVAPDTEPPPGHAVLVKLQEALRQLSSSGDVDPGGLVRCKASNPNVPRYVDAWRQVLKCRLKPAGFFRKQPRDVVDIVSETAKEVWSANQALEAFNVAKKLNNPKGLDVNTFVLHYLMQSGRFYQTVSDILTTPDVLEKLYFEDSIFRTQEAIRFLLRLMKDAKRLRFDFRFILPEEDIQYLEAVDRQAAQEAEAAGAQGRLHSPSASPAAVPSAAPPAVPPPNASGPAADQRQPTLSVTFEDAPGAAERAQQPEEDDEESRALDPRYFVAVSEEFDQANVLGKVSFAVKQLHEYFRASRTRLQRQSAPPGSLTQVFDEPKHGVIGLLARERLCPALCALLRAGFKEEKLFGKRHPWQFIEAAAAQCRSNATDLGGSLLPGAVDCVTAIIDKRTTSSPPASPVGRSKAQFAVLDTKLRTLLCYALNNCHTKAYFETLFDTEQGGKNDFVGEWYVVDQTPLLDKGIRAELDSLLSLLSRIRFQLTLDADVW